jgi:hypothetical protein
VSESLRTEVRGLSSDFVLVKWYLDCVDRHGHTVIAYWASLAWGGLSFTWQSLELYEANRATKRRWSVQRSSPPERLRTGISWQAPALGCAITIEARQPSFAVRLIDAPPTSVEWAVECPVGQVTVDIDGMGTVRGDGYAERLESHAPPWRLPITELRWGRCVVSEPARSVVWIDWRGALPRSWVFRDGRLESGASVSDTAISGNGFALSIVPESRLVHRALAEILEPLPMLRSLLPSSILALSESKWLGTGCLSEQENATMNAPVLYELVRLR